MAKFEMKRYVISLVICIVAAFFVGFVAGVNYGGGDRSAAKQGAAPPGQKEASAPACEPQKPAQPAAPDFSLESADGGKTVSLKDFAGFDLVLLVTTISCPVCRKQIDEIRRIYKEYADKGVRFVNAVIAETDEFGGRMILEDDFVRYTKEVALPFPAYMDNEDSIANDYNVQSVPVLAFITKDGGLACTRPFTYAPDMARILDAMLAGEEIDTSEMSSLSG